MSFVQRPVSIRDNLKVEMRIHRLDLAGKTGRLISLAQNKVKILLLKNLFTERFALEGESVKSLTILRIIGRDCGLKGKENQQKI